jgi:hypothetical protein
MVNPDQFIRLTVNDRQREKGNKIGLARYDTKNQFSSTRNLSKINTHVCGAIAEVMFAEWQGLTVDERVHDFRGDNMDFMSRRGESIDIKVSTFVGRDIELKEKVENVDKNKIKDIYILCRAIICYDLVTEISVIGWITKAEYLVEENKKSPYVPNNTKYPWNYVVGLDKLHPFVGTEYGEEITSRSDKIVLF